MSIEWPTQNTAEQKPVEQIDKIEGEQNLEQELSAEQIEQIMAKVQDIDTEGLCYKAIDISSHWEGEDKKNTDPWKIKKFQSILKDGFLGADYSSDEKHSQAFLRPLDKNLWAKNIRNGKQGLVHYNSVGNSGYIQGVKPYGDMPEIAYNYYVYEFMNKQNFIFVLFNTDHFKNVELFDGLKEGFLKYDSFDAAYTKDPTKKLSHLFKQVNLKTKQKTKLKNDTELGFTASHRIAPRCFNGIVIRARNIDGKSKNPEGYDEGIKNVLDSMKLIYPDVNKWMPIYNVWGDLLWPKQMKYQEVKNFVADRDAKNTNKDEK
ncbi:MAG TPA: hypothetical protein VF817_03640 [Patescibacteria group bacterium]